jgi:plastocyanin
MLHHMPRSRILGTLAIAVVMALAATVPSTLAATTKPKHHVTIKGNYIDGYQFKPQTITIKKGQTVHWSWNSDAEHNVTFTTPDKHSKTAAKVSDYHIKFKHKGTFEYTCTVHGFTGKVVVKKP